MTRRMKQKSKSGQGTATLVVAYIGRSIIQARKPVPGGTLDVSISFTSINLRVVIHLDSGGAKDIGTGSGEEG